MRTNSEYSLYNAMIGQTIDESLRVSPSRQEGVTLETIQEARETICSWWFEMLYRFTYESSAGRLVSYLTNIWREIDEDPSVSRKYRRAFNAGNGRAGLTASLRRGKKIKKTKFNGRDSKGRFTNEA